MPLTATQLRKALDVMDEAELRELIEALYKASTDNKRFLTSRLENDKSELLEVYVKELEKCFDPKKGELRVASAKKAMQNYLRVASPVEMLQAKIRYVGAALAYWQKLPYWPENHDTTLGNMLKDITNVALNYPEQSEILNNVHRIGREFIKQERKFGCFDWHVQIYKDFAKALEK
ncbi:hypothetical protein GCM10022631_24990 [Deinococcus rubellus]|uniref:hypothetical protein n=1 Tax=Deinococcus rubellus TaxID=1889240 RepID=UPI0031EF4E74